MALFLGQTPCTGFNSLNNLLLFLRLPTVNPEAPFIRHITKFFLIRQLRVACHILRKQDTKLSIEDLSKYPEQEIDQICFNRGIRTKGKSLKKKIKDIQIYLAVSNLRNATNTLLIYLNAANVVEESYNQYSNDLWERIILRDVRIFRIYSFFHRSEE